MWQPIDAAPEGVVVLTDEGTAIKTDPFCLYGYGKPKINWYLCDSEGNIPRCADDGYDPARLAPRFWMPFPEVPRGDYTVVGCVFEDEVYHTGCLDKSLSYEEKVYAWQSSASDACVCCGKPLEESND